MITTVGALSILPPLLAIVLAIATRRVVLALFAGICVGWAIAGGGHWLPTLTGSAQVFVTVLMTGDQQRVIIFTLLMGALLMLMTRSGGIEGFIQWMAKWRMAQTRRSAQLFAWAIGLGIYIESTITCLIVGTVSRPLFDRLKISREKLAYIVDSTAAPVCILIPFNGWGAAILGLLLVQAEHNQLANYSALGLFIAAMPFNFYAIFSVVCVFWVCWSDWHIGAMALAEQRAREGQVLHDTTRVHNEARLLQQSTAPGVRPRASRLCVPLICMMVAVVAGILLTGMAGARQAARVAPTLMDILQHASGATAVLAGVSLALVVLMVQLLIGGECRLRELLKAMAQGVYSMRQMAVLMLLAFAMGATCDALGTGVWLAGAAAPWFSPVWVAPMVFIVSACIAFSTGTSWGTFAIMIPLALPLAAGFNTPTEMVVSLPLVLGAVLGGGVFGDHCSPISDTTVIASMASCCDHIDHVRSQLPYALWVGGLSVVIYSLLGFWFQHSP